MNTARTSRSLKDSVRFVCGFTLGGLLLGLLLWRTGPGEVLQALQTISPVAPLVTLAVLLLSIPLRTLQWQWLMTQPARRGFVHTLRAVCLGYAANLLFPLRGGEVLKALYCSRKHGLAFERTFTALVLCRFQDLFPVFLLTVLAVGALSGPLAARLSASPESDTTHYRHAFVLMGLALATAVTVLAAAYRIRQSVLRWICAAVARIAPQRAQWLQERFRQIAHALDVFSQPRYYWSAQALSFLCWALFTLAALPILRAAGLDWTQACFCALAINGLATLIQLLPAAPGDVGTYHAACVAALQLAAPNLPLPRTLAIAVLLHAVGTMGPALPGFFLLPLMPRAWAASPAALETVENTK